MFTPKILALLAGAGLAFAAGGSISVTPHDAFSSTIGVAGCYIDTNRVAYWPSWPGCDNMCKKVTYGDRSVYLLHIDVSGGAHDISYDAWNYLSTGQSAQTNPTAGGGITATWEDVDMAECASLIKTPSGKLPFLAANGMNTVAACHTNPWFGANYELRNIANSQCTYGVDELCTINMAAGENQPTCPHQLGLQSVLTSPSVFDIKYPSGQVVKAV